MILNQYAIVIVNLDPTIGSEIKKTKPCIILSPNEMNRNLKTIVIAPMTSSLNNYPTRIKVIHKNKEGRIAIDQIRTIDKIRIVRVDGKLSHIEIENTKSVINRTFVL